MIWALQQMKLGVNSQRQDLIEQEKEISLPQQTTHNSATDLSCLQIIAAANYGELLAA